ncbi:unnamed protein product, partial [Mesorhabditis spiculigera]
MNPALQLAHDLLRSVIAFNSFVASRYTLRTSWTASSALQIFDKKSHYGDELAVMRFDHPHLDHHEYAHINLEPRYAGRERDPHYWLPPGSAYLAALLGGLIKFFYKYLRWTSHGFAIVFLGIAIWHDTNPLSYHHTLNFLIRLTALHFVPGIAAKAVSWIGTSVMPVLGTALYGLLGALFTGVLINIAAREFENGYTLHWDNHYLFVGLVVLGIYVATWIAAKIGSSLGECFAPGIGTFLLGAVASAGPLALLWIWKPESMMNSGQ